jgi:hypothetical protein
MAKGKKHTPEQIVGLLRQVEVAVANGKTTPVACRESGIRFTLAWGIVLLDHHCQEAPRSCAEIDVNIPALGLVSTHLSLCYYFVDTCREV